MIVVDTEMLKQLAVIAGNANEEVRSAADILNSVATHNDWGCKERNTINDYTIQNKSRIKQISEASANFYNIINAVADEFAGSEKEIPSMFSSVDSIIGQIISIPVPVSINPVVSQRTVTEITERKSWEHQAMEIVKKASKPIRVVKFDELDFKG